MGLDMRPMGKPKPGFEKRFVEIFEMVSQDKIPQPTFFDKLKGKKMPTKDELDELLSYDPETGKNYEAPRPALGAELYSGWQASITKKLVEYAKNRGLNLEIGTLLQQTSQGVGNIYERL